MYTESSWLFQKQMRSNFASIYFRPFQFLLMPITQKKLPLKPPQTLRVHLCQLIYLEHCQDQETSKRAWWEAKINTKLYYIQPSMPDAEEAGKNNGYGNSC